MGEDPGLTKEPPRCALGIARRSVVSWFALGVLLWLKSLGPLPGKSTALECGNGADPSRSASMSPSAITHRRGLPHGDAVLPRTRLTPFRVFSPQNLSPAATMGRFLPFASWFSSCVPNICVSLPHSPTWELLGLINTSSIQTCLFPLHRGPIANGASSPRNSHPFAFGWIMGMTPLPFPSFL